MALAAHLFLACTLSGAAYGAEWSFRPSLQARALFVDNIYMRAEDPVSTWGGTISPMLNLTRRTPTGAVDVGGRLIFHHYDEEAIRDTDVRLLTLSGRTRAKRSRWNVRGFYKSDTTVTSITEVAVEDPVDETENGDADELDGGIVDVDLVVVEIRRNQLRLQPSWTWAMTQRNSLRLGYRLNDVRYSGEDLLDDYRTHGVEVALRRELSLRNNLEASVAAARYERPDREISSDDYTIRLNLTRDFSPLTRGRFAVGVRSTKVTRDDLRDESEGATVNIGLTRRPSPSTRYRMDLERSVRPSGSASAVFLSDLFRISATHDLTPRLSLMLRGLAFRNESLDPERTSADRVYYSIETGFNRMMTRFWSIGGSYRYRWQKYAERADSVDSNGVYLSISYAWPRIAVSR
jgi:hypothetical protein